MLKHKRVGERKKTNCGLYAEIVAYNNCNEILVRFDNGMDKKTTYRNFVAGNVLCPMLYEYVESGIKVTNPNGGATFLIDEVDLDKVTSRTWHITNDGYVAARVSGNNKMGSKIEMLHRLIMRPPTGMLVDHVNHIKTDNRRANLRLATKAENGMNARLSAGNRSGYKGVSFDKRSNRWRAYITREYRQIHLGYFDCARQAAQAYDATAANLFGEFANTNFKGVAV
jgi:hypothetical protein